MQNHLDSLSSYLHGQNPLESLLYLVKKYPNKVIFSTSFGAEDQVITDFIFANNIPIKVFTLDTGRNFQESYSTWNRTLERYKKKIEVFAPKTAAIQKLVAQKGPNSFYESVENRKECCYIRKIEPLQRALKNQTIWITGIRADQSPNRLDMSNLEWDTGNNLIKFHPLFDWSFQKVRDHIKEKNIPYNTLHDKGFVSIGCAPCTRAIKEGEDFRAGRWWWEDASKKECGLHSIDNGKLIIDN
jgi:phosphoadenosine phosphosulfate reductase